MYGLNSQTILAFRKRTLERFGQEFKLKCHFDYKVSETNFFKVSCSSFINPFNLYWTSTTGYTVR